jgi:outer membrane protein assembly factor BamB
MGEPWRVCACNINEVPRLADRLGRSHGLGRGAGLVDPALAASSAGWSQPGYGPGQTFYNADESVINGDSIEDISRRWQLVLPETEEWSCTGPTEPLVVGGRLFINDATGIGSYAAKTGKLLWHHTFGWPDDETTPHLAVSCGLLLAGNNGCRSQSDPDGGIIALDVVTGKKRWSVGTDTPVESMVVDQGIVAVAGSSMSDEAAVYGFRVSDGKQRWRLPLYWSPGVSAKGKLLVSRTDKAGTAAVSITTDKVLWTKAKEWYGQAASPAGDRFFVSDSSGNLLCLNSSNGALVWTAKNSATWMATDGRRVYRTVTNGIEALDVKNGKRLWTAYFEGDTGQPVRAGGLLYTNVDAGEPVGILHVATGKVASSGWQIGGLDDDEHVVVAGGWLYTLYGNVVEAYAP